MSDWHAFDNVDLPVWATEEHGKMFCSFLNAYIPKEYSTTGTRYSLLNRYPSGRLYFFLHNRSRGV